VARRTIPDASEGARSGYPGGVAVETGTAADFLPARPTLSALRDASRRCTACPLWRTGTQTVFGEGLKRARLLLVGEQPGDREDLEGRPFVGPAGRLLDEALAEAGIERAEAYVTNAVKHFKWIGRGPRRIHQKPSRSEIAACRPWLDAELAVVAPEVLVCLGATAAQALLGRAVRVTRDRGRPLESALAPVALATVHPSSILRAPDAESRRRERALFVDDLRVAASALGGG
jgi:uracil-DNA glycosylase